MPKLALIAERISGYSRYKILGIDILLLYYKRENKSWDLVRFGGEVITIPNFVGPGITRFTREKSNERERERKKVLSFFFKHIHARSPDGVKYLPILDRLPILCTHVVG